MSRTRAEIEKEITTYKGDLASRTATLNGPTWANSKHDYRYREMLQQRDEVVQKLSELERELLSAKARGERGRSPAEIEEEIAETQKNINVYSSMIRRDGANTPKGYLGVVILQSFESKIGPLQEELSRAIEEEKEYKERERREQEAKKIAEEMAAKKAAEEAAAKKVAEEAAAKKAAEEAVAKKAAEVEQERSKKIKESSGNEFTVDFLREFFNDLAKFNDICKKIELEAEKELQNMTSKQKENETQMLNKQKNDINFFVERKKSALSQYESKLKELNNNEEKRQNALYDKITKCKAQNIIDKNVKNKEEIERIRAEIFANKESIKQGRDELWSEYQSECEKILKIIKEKQCENDKERSYKDKVQRKYFEKFKAELEEKTFNRIKQETDNFIGINAFVPDKINNMYTEIYDSDPLVADYKCIKSDNHPKSIRMAMLTYDLSLLNLGKCAKMLLETHYPMFYRNKKLIMPYCINISKTNGVCFSQTNDNRNSVYKTIQSFILKLLLKIQPGLLKLTLYDGEGSGKNLIGLSHIDKKIKGENILTDQNELKRALEAAVSDMNTTIQKVLGSKYADRTLIDYNEDVGKQEKQQEKPYHIICITDFPNGVGREHLELISKIVRSGKQAGVFIIMGSDTEFAPKNSYDRIDTSSLLSEMNVVTVGSLGNNINLDLSDYFPDTDLLEQIQEYISAELKKVSKVEINLDSRIGENKLWQSDSRNGIETPIGQLNVTELQNFTLSLEDAPHHCLIGGATGSGKTVLLHNIICYTAWNYSPDEVQFILLDYKEGTEFKVYENLPHAKVLSIHSEREYGISVLEYINAEIESRGEKFKKVNAKNVAKYRENSGEIMPRLLIIIDEFQKLLDGDMRTTSFVSTSLDDIGRRGRSFGINLILSSQSLSGVDINQALSHLGLRIVLKLNTERDCDLFLRQGNYAPFKSLQKTGEAIYNARSGLTEDNVTFRVAYLSDKDIDEKISVLQEKTVEKYGSNKPFKRFLYDGNSSASIENNNKIPEVYTLDYRRCKIYIGEPVALEEEHSSYSLLRQNESNVLIIGQDILAAMSIFNHSIQQIVPQSLEESQIYVCNKVNIDSKHYDKLDSLPEKFSNVKLLENDQEISKTIEVFFEEVEKRKIESSKNRIVLVFADIYNVRLLRKNGYTDSPLAQKLVTILKDGPGLGVHCIVHASSYDNAKNVFDVNSMLNEFNVRIELRGGDGYKIFQSNDIGVEKSTPDNWNIANIQTSQMNGIRKIKVYSF
jgi:hypothetical protein